MSWRQVLRTAGHVPDALRLVLQASVGGTVVLALLTVLAAVMPVALVYVGKLIIDAVVTAAGNPADLAARNTVVELVLLELGLVVAQVVLQRASGLVRQLVGEKLGVHINVLILEKALTLELSHFEDSEFYDRLTRARREASSRPLSVVVQTFSLVQNALSLVGYLVALWALGGWVVGLLVLASLPGFISEVKFSADAFRLRNRQSADSRRLWYLEYVLATDTHAKEVKLFGLGAYFLQRYRDLAVKLFRENSVVAVQRAVWGTLLGLLSTGAFYACYAVIALRAARGEITLGELTLYTLAFRQGQGAFQSVLSSMGSMYESQLYMSNLLDFLKAQVGTTPTLPAPVSVQGAAERGVRFENVTFQYPGASAPALRDVSMFIPAGTSAALVGPNGAGKTTFIKLLTGLYTPSSGRVLLDGKDLRAWDGDALRARMGVIFQDYNRYQLLLRENVGVGAVEQILDETRIRHAVEKGGAEELVRTLPGGLDASLGRWFARGVELSGGQWQSVALARSFMRQDADVLILDEPTAALDAEAEYLVFQRFKELTRGRTSIVISHRFPTVRLADRIFVLADGKLAEQGTHQELLDAGGTYARMFRLQAEGYQ
ncbi:MAG: ABC transporter ATP-binding protein [Myxococcota bacterium]